MGWVGIANGSSFSGVWTANRSTFFPLSLPHHAFPRMLMFVTDMEATGTDFIFKSKKYGVAWDERLFKIADRYFAPLRFNPKIFSS
jgi:hypothetical protein